jgi:hypothetical protein
MPCYEDPYGMDSAKVAKAIVCGIIRAIAPDPRNIGPLLDRINWAEVGIRRSDFENWWADHLRMDAYRDR